MKTYKWTVEFSVSENWVEDGFNITDETAKEMLANYLSYAYGYELDAKVKKAPNQEQIQKLQGIKA